MGGAGAALARTLPAKRGIAVSAETMRRRLHKIGSVCKRPTPVATADDPHRITRLARLRWVFVPLMVMVTREQSGFLPCQPAPDLEPAVGG